MGSCAFGRRFRHSSLGLCLLALGGSASGAPPLPPANPQPPAAPVPALPPATATPPTKWAAPTTTTGLTIVAHERRRTAIPVLRIPEPTVGPSASIAPETITRIFIRSARAALHDCYLRELIAEPALTGTLLTEFLVVKDGTVRSAQVIHGLTPGLDACVLAQIKQTEFPHPVHGDQVLVRYPFNFLLH